ncbi:amino acid transporter [Apiospora sp. TS-2023a]
MAKEDKFNYTKRDAPIDIELDSDIVDPEDGNAEDRRDMHRMGKTQELKRNFRFISIFGFTMILMQSWEAIFSLGVIGLTNGGTAGYIWMYLVSWIGFIFVNLSMAEMASMAPTTGGQYHWVSEFAPRKYQKFLSYIMGWMCVLAWQTIIASTCYIAGTQIQGLLVLNYSPQYEPHPWHGTLLAIALAAFGVFFNIILARRLPLVEAGLLSVHILGFIAVLATLWVLAPRAPASQVFTTFNDGGGWGSVGTSTMVGITAAFLPLVGADAAVHMSEELQDASRTLPRSMIATTLVNGALGWIMLITFCSTLGNLNDILDSPTGVPFIAMFFNTTQSAGGATAMSVLIIVMTIAGILTQHATASHVYPRFNLPINSIMTTLIFTILLTLIAIGSPVAFNTLTSLGGTAIMSSYICSIGCVLWRRITHKPLLPSKLSLGRYGLFINLVSMLFLIVTFVFSFFPPSPNPTPDLMNWNILIWGASVLGSLIYYVAVARKVYVGPVEYVRKLD